MVFELKEKNFLLSFTLQPSPSLPLFSFLHGPANPTELAQFPLPSLTLSLSLPVGACMSAPSSSSRCHVPNGDAALVLPLWTPQCPPSFSSPP